MADAEVKGYEIHAGISQGQAFLNPLIKLESGEMEGSMSEDQQILGTYMHGVFDCPEACSSLLQWAEAKSIQPIDLEALSEEGIELMASTVKQYMNMPLLEEKCRAFTAGKKKAP
ncbi:MAG: hypothetical protein HOE45_11985 [Gammaproteobacteria bacterium]|nr:hypothetical protein [Gammaproteobacteria bacterium]